MGSFIYDELENDSDILLLGLHIFENESIYIGHWKNGYKHSSGKQIWKDGQIYEGYWKNNKGFIRLLYKQQTGEAG